jgi:asparagine synthetase B (glutamine-hydrolysing)
VRKVQDLYKYDLLRANKSCLAWGIEVRPPFLSKSFIEYVMSIDPQYKMTGSHNPPIEKYILRYKLPGHRLGKHSMTRLIHSCPRRFCGGRRNSSATELATCGEMASGY